MRTSDELFERVVARMEAHEKKQQQRIRTIKRIVPVLACFCFAVIGGLSIWKHTEKLPTAPEQSTKPETTATSTMTVSGIPPQTTECTAVTSTAVSSAKMTQIPTESTSGSVQQSASTALQTDTSTETVVSAGQTETAASVSTTVPTESQTVRISAETVAQPEQTAESTTIITAAGNPYAPPFFVIGEPEIETSTTTSAKSPSLPDLPGFEVTRESGGWYVQCLEPVSPSPDSNILYTVNSDQFAIEDAVSILGGKELAGMYAFRHLKSRQTIPVLQYRRESFCFTCSRLKEPESGIIGTIPCLWGKEYNGTVLYWDDGYYTFRMWIDSDDRAILKELAECMVQAEVQP